MKGHDTFQYALGGYAVWALRDPHGAKRRRRAHGVAIRRGTVLSLARAARCPHRICRTFARVEHRQVLLLLR